MSQWFPKANIPITDRPMSLDWYKFFARWFASLDTASVAVTSDYTVTKGGFYEVDASAGPVTITVEGVVQNGYPTVMVKKIDATANAVTVVATTGTIDGAANKSWSGQWWSYTFYPSPSNTSNWGIV